MRHHLSGWRALGGDFRLPDPGDARLCHPAWSCCSKWRSSPGRIPFEGRYLGFVQNSLTLASDHGDPHRRGRGHRRLLRAARAGQGGHGFHQDACPASAMRVPGSVIAVGLLVPFARLDNTDRRLHARAFRRLDRAAVHRLHRASGGDLYRALHGGRPVGLRHRHFSQIKPNVDAVARTLGSGARHADRDPPAADAPSLLTAVLIVFVDTMKELPATLIMRPFNFDTLAVQAHRLASDERLAAGGPAVAGDRRLRAAAGDPAVLHHRQVRPAAKPWSGPKVDAFAAKALHVS
jgi:iron(III) transport system permease protein